MPLRRSTRTIKLTAKAQALLYSYSTGYEGLVEDFYLKCDLPALRTDTPSICACCGGHGEREDGAFVVQDGEEVYVHDNCLILYVQ